MIKQYTASALIFDSNKNVLVVFHPRMQLWLYPGGHVEENESPVQAVLREVAEEVGLAVTIIHPELPELRGDATPIPTPFLMLEEKVVDTALGQHIHMDCIYVCSLAGPLTELKLSEVTGARWVALAEVSNLPTPPEFPELIRLAIAHLERYGSGSSM